MGLKTRVSRWGIMGGILLSGLLGTGLLFAEDRKESLEPQLKAALTEAQKRLGELEGWQKVIFSEEVLPQYQRFVRDYRASASGVQADIDLESLRRYLIFYAPKHVKQKDAKIFVVLKVDANCSKCTESTPLIQKLIRGRLEKRGLNPVWLNPEDIGSPSSTLGLEGQLALMSKQKNAAGTLLVKWSPAPVDDLDTAHADEKRYVIQSILKIGQLAVQNRQKELLENDSFEQAESRLLTDIFTDLGTKIEWEVANSAEVGKEEVLIEVTGIRDFNQYTQLKNIIQSKLKEQTPVEDRILSKEQIVFAVYTKKKSDEIRREIGDVHFDLGGGQAPGVVVR